MITRLRPGWNAWCSWGLRLPVALLGLGVATSSSALSMLAFGPNTQNALWPTMSPGVVIGPVLGAPNPMLGANTANPIEVAAGPWDATLLLNVDGTVWGCGDEADNAVNDRWPLGRATNAANLGSGTFRQLCVNGNLNQPLSNIISLSQASKSRAFMSAALRADGVPFTWGRNAQNGLNIVGGLANGATWLTSRTWTSTGFTYVLGQGLTFTSPVLPVTTDDKIFQPYAPNVANSTSLLTGIKQIAQNLCAFFALRDDGQVAVWGADPVQYDPLLQKYTLAYSFYGLGNILQPGDPDEQKTPLVAQNLNDFKQIDGGLRHGAGLKANGEIYCWGGNDKGQCGRPSTGQTGVFTQYVPDCVVMGLPVTPMPGMPRFKDVACAQEETFALGVDGTVWGWGKNMTVSNPPASIFGNPNLPAYVAQPTQVVPTNGLAPLNDIVDIWCGEWQLFALRGNGQLVVLGDRSQTNGAGTASQPLSYVTAPVEEVISGSGARPFLVLRATAVNTVWSSNAVPTLVPQPTLLGQAKGIRKLAKFGSDQAFIDNRGVIHLLVGSTWTKISPPNETFIDLAIVSGGVVAAINVKGQLFMYGALTNYGLPNSPNELTYVSIQNLIGVELTIDCITVLTGEGKVRTKGATNSTGLMGTGTTIPSPHWETVQMPAKNGATQDLVNIIQISSAGQTKAPTWGPRGGHTLALSVRGNVFSWGAWEMGQLARGGNTSLADLVMTKSPSKFVFTDPLLGIKQVAAGTQFSLALGSNGTVRSWGSNGAGQLGWPSLSSPSEIVRPVTSNGTLPLALVKEIAATLSNGFFLRADGVLFGTGANSPLGLGMIGQQTFAKSVGGTNSVDRGWRLFKGPESHFGAVIR